MPYIEIEDGERVTEGGQMHGYEVIKILPTEVVLRRNGQIQSYLTE